MISQLKKYNRLHCQLILAAAILLPCLAWAQAGEPIGTVLTSNGEVIAQSNGNSGTKRALKRRDSVYVGDTIMAGPKSRVRFKLTDDSTYVVRENSTFIIEEYNYNGSEDGSEVADFYFSEGVMEFVSGYIGKQDQTKFRIDTDFAAIGLRGSGGIITTGSGSTQVFVTLGQLTAVSKQGQLFVLNNGQTTVLSSDGETTTQQGNATGAEQTMTTDGEDISAEDGDAEEGEGQESEEEQAEEEQAEEEQAEEEQSESDEQEQNQEEQQGADEEIAASDPDEETEDSNEEGAAEDSTESAADDSSGSESETASSSETASTADNPTTDAQLSAAEIYAELIPDSVEATQDDLAEALNEAIEAYPVLYAELVNVAIDAGLEPPAAALTATEALGGGGNVSENVVTEIFFVATEGLTDTTDVDAALTAVGAPPLEAQGTGSAQVSVDAGGVGTDAPSNNASAPVTSASPAQ